MIWIQILEYRTGEMLYKFGFPSTVLTFQDGSFFRTETLLMIFTLDFVFVPAGFTSTFDYLISKRLCDPKQI